MEIDDGTEPKSLRECFDLLNRSLGRDHILVKGDERRNLISQEDVITGTGTECSIEFFKRECLGVRYCGRYMDEIGPRNCKTLGVGLVRRLLSVDLKSVEDGIPLEEEESQVCRLIGRALIQIQGHSLDKSALTNLTNSIIGSSENLLYVKHKYLLATRSALNQLSNSKDSQSQSTDMVPMTSSVSLSVTRSSLSSSLLESLSLQINATISGDLNFADRILLNEYIDTVIFITQANQDEFLLESYLRLFLNKLLRDTIPDIDLVKGAIRMLTCRTNFLPSFVEDEENLWMLKRTLVKLSNNGSLDQNLRDVMIGIHEIVVAINMKDLTLLVEIDSRETCFCGISSKLFSSLDRPFLRFIDKEVVVYVVEEKGIAENSIRISKNFASALSLERQVACCVAKEPTTTAPGTIIISPMSVDDWEVVETQSVFLESAILSQINSLSPNQVFPVWTGRGQKPVLLRVVGGIDTEWAVLRPDTELAIESRMRKDMSMASDKVQKILRVRVIDTGFPVDDFLGIGLIVNNSDFIKSFGPESGCLVTIRDRPDILTLVACDSSLVDPGIVLVSPLMRDIYGLVSGQRVVIEQYSEDVSRCLLTPTILHVYWSSLRTNFEMMKSFKSFVAKAVCTVVPQGGFLALDSSTTVQIKFEPSVHPMSKAACVLSTKNIDEVIIQNFQLTETPNFVPVKPYLKYCPESVHSCITSASDPPLTPLIPSFEPIAKRVSRYIENSLQNSSIDMPFSSSVLISGSGPMTGGSTIVDHALRSLSPPVFSVTIDCCSLSCARRFKLEDVKAAFSGLVRFGFESPPFILVFDKIDKLIPSEKVTDGDEETLRRGKRGVVVAEFLNDILASLKPNRSMVIIGTATSDNPYLARLFAHYERIPSKLSFEDREVLLPPNFEGNVDGYSLCELIEIRRTGRDHRGLRKQLISGKAELQTVINSIGGMDKQMNQLVDGITLPMKFPFLFGKNGITSTGAFVIGPSGCGKSLLVQHVVNKIGVPVEIVRGPDLLDKYIGASEQGVRKVFKKAATIAPCVVVFDAIDALCPRRGSESTGVTDRVVNQMLCYLDGVDRLEGVFVIAITSRPDMVDPALTRPGRLDLVVVCDVPTLEEKSEVISAIAKDFDLVLPESDIGDLLTNLSPNITGADIRSGFVNAKITANRQKSTMDIELVKKCMREVKPSISANEFELSKRQLERYIHKERLDVNSIATRVSLH